MVISYAYCTLNRSKMIHTQSISIVIESEASFLVCSMARNFAIYIYIYFRSTVKYEASNVHGA